ncbi:MAG TPA: choice-of-anchor L domain-containing protein [Bacteroidia bacterium]|jgi:gliding motility-associated-like protein|nr:choice-of-anchor L domain-containing protein [Bacteroidia bacterium]
MLRSGVSHNKILIAVIYLLLPAFVFSQMNVSPNSSASSLAQAIAGNGVTVSNTTINCGANAAATFTYAGANLGLTGGIILTTGKATDVANPGSYFCNVINGNNYNDPDLTAIVPTANFDVCLLEFDFVPTCNSLNMTFVFGSEEYPTGVGGYNDAFAIFLTGPNPSGGNYTAQNIALLPNGTPVSINNVNASTNTSYFHNNYVNPNNDIAYNGYTIPVTSVTSVVPCSTYKMKIAIADAGNALYDSGVFISGNGVSCQNPATITASSTPTSCGNTGSATATVANYTGTATYQWHPGGQTTSTITNLGAGTYTCIVSLHQACGVITQTVSTTVAAVGNNMVLTSTQQNLTCYGANNASANVTAIGGASPYSCVWSTTPVQNGFSVSNLSAGTYSATVTDNAGCQSTIQINITAPPVMQLSINTSPATCTGSTGTASVSVSNHGTAPYTYSWNTNPVQNTQSATNIPQGIYNVTVTDANHCSVTGTATVNTQSPGWTLSSPGITNVSCYGGNNGSASVIINNAGSSVFTYSWNTNPIQNSLSASNLFSGNYTCTVTDNNGCVQNVSANISQPALLTLSVTSVPTLCRGSVGSISASAIGGTPPYTYTWGGMPLQTSSVAQGLAQGQYSLTITDAHNCGASAVTSVGSINQTLQITQSVINSACGGPSGAVNITSVTPASPPYSYSWVTGQTTQSINNLSPGIYVVTVTDNNGCAGNVSAAVNINNSLPVQVNTVQDFCNQAHGSATANPSGNPPYQYLWNTTVPQTTQTATNLPAGNYMVHVTDAFNCKDSVSVTIVNQNDVFTSAFTTWPGSELYSQDEVTMNLSTNAGWTFNNGYLTDGSTISGVNMNHIFTQSGDYTAVYYFTSSHGCKDSAKYEIHIKDYTTLYIPNSFSPNSDGTNDVFKAEGTLVKSFEMYIYDRWGNLIIKLDDIEKGWDGKYKGEAAPIGTYVYKAIATDVSGKEINLSGDINLIR